MLQKKVSSIFFEEISIESTGNWKNIIFFPFSLKWQWALMFSVFVESSMIIYFLAYIFSTSFGGFVYVYYSCEAIYLFDTILFILHRNFKNYAQKQVYSPRNLFALAIDVLTIIPYYEIIYLVLSTSVDNYQVTPYIFCIPRFKVLIRVYRIITHFQTLGETVGINQVLVVTSRHITMCILFCHVIGAVWYRLGCYLCTSLNWTCNLKDHTFNEHSSLEWLIISYCEMANKFFHNSTGLVKGETVTEKIIVLMLMIIGFSSHIMIFNAQLTSVYLKLFKKKNQYVNHLKGIKLILKDWDATKLVSIKIKKYYNSMWKQRRGIKFVPESFYILPDSLQKDLILDMFWEALRHSHMFSNMDIAFKRAVASVMKAEFFMPGNFICKVNERKNKVYYIVSGIVQILSDEDGESPVLSFTSGTLLGEVVGLMNTINIVNVRCATFCEIYTISFIDFYRLISKGFRTRIKTVMSYRNDRLDNATEVESVAEIYRHNEEFKNESTIKWLKNQWKNFTYASTLNKSASSKFKLNICPARCSDYLNLYVLADDVNLKMKAICLTNNFPYVMEPRSSARKAWEYINLLLIFINSVLLPYYVSFNRAITLPMYSFLLLFTLVSVLDIWIQLSTAIKKKEVTITDPLTIFINSCKNMWFLLDCLATFPLVFICVYFNARKHTCAIVSMNMLLKTYKIFQFVLNMQKLLSVGYLFLIIKYIVFHALCLYWITAILHMTTCYYSKCDSDGFYNYNHMLLSEALNENVVVEIELLFFVASVFLGIGLSDKYQYNAKDTIICHLLLVVGGYFMFTFCFSELCATFVHTIQSKLNYIEQQQHFKSILEQANVSHLLNLSNKVVSYMEFRWSFNHQVDFEAVNDYLNNCSEELKQEVVNKKVKSELKKSILFQDCDDHFLNCLIQHCNLRLYPTQEIIVVAGRICQDIHIILKGHVRILSKMAGDEQKEAVQMLTEGDSFGVLEGLYSINLFITAETVTVVETCTIPIIQLMRTYKAFPHYYQEIKTVLEKHLELNRNTILRLGGRLPEMYAAEKSLGQVDYFKFKIIDSIYDTAKEQYMKPFLKLGKWQILRFILLKRTIKSCSKFYLVWETIRCACIFVSIMLMATTQIFIKYSKIIYYFKMVIDLIYLPDSYIRLHVQYYNSNGLLVTHPLWTAKHYLSTSFITDTMATIPIIVFKYSTIKGNGRIFMLLFMFACKQLHYYRIHGLLYYLQANASYTKNKFLDIFKYFIIIIMAWLTLAAMNNDLFCTYHLDDDDNVIEECEKDSFIFTSVFKDRRNPEEVFVYSIYIVTMQFTGAVCGVFRSITTKEVLWFMFLFFFGFNIKWFLLARITSMGIVENMRIVTKRTHIESFIKFMDNEIIDERLTEICIEHFEHDWKKTRGANFLQLLEKLPINLHMTVSYTLYGNSVKNVALFKGEGTSFINMFCGYVSQNYFKSGAEIIRCNDVQKNIFIVHKGSVDIYVAMCKISTLCPGGIFGNLSELDMIRQSIKVVANVNTEVLVMTNSLFQQLIAKSPNAIYQFRKAKVMQMEYIEPLVNYEEQTCYVTDNHQSRGYFKRILQKVFKTIDQNNQVYKFFNYIISVHIAPISTLITTYFIFMLPDNWNFLRVVFIHTIDAIFIVKMLVTFLVTYTDADSGKSVDNIKKISKRFLKSGIFFYELFSNLPINIIVSIFFGNRTAKFFFSNRLLRFVHLEFYYRESKNKLTLGGVLKWSHILYWLLLFIQFCTSVWYLTACNGGCKQVKLTLFRTDPVVIRETKDEITSQLLAYSYVVNVFTSTGLRDTSPVTKLELLISILISVLSLYLMCLLISSVASILVIRNNRMMEFEYNMDMLMEYLDYQNVSPILVETCWKYLTTLWRQHEGEINTQVLAKAPNYIKQDIMMGLYGKYIEQHHLFSNTHIDFIRQLVCFFERCIYYPGNTILEKGDHDESMYFIHKGYVEQFELMGNNYKFRKALGPGESFGERQGLYFIPHMHTYKALTIVEIVVLKRKGWIYLLNYFPASKLEIEAKAVLHGIIKPNQNSTIYTFI